MTNGSKILDKKIVKLNGGLGNQMFQYAFALAISKRFDAEILFDFSYFEDVKSTSNVTTRVFEMGVFDVDCKAATAEDLAGLVYPDAESKLETKFRRFFPRLCGVTFVREKYSYSYDAKLFNNPSFKFYEGYFQNEKYFKNIRPELLKRFSLREPLNKENQEVLDEIKNTNSVSLHIRRGDYITLDYVNKIHGVCSLDYYAEAIKYIAKKVKNPHFYIFSDDIQWVLENLKTEYPLTFVDFNQGKGHLDMELMKNCKHNIVANSSFSWWGAWLNQNPDKIVIAPKHWTSKKQVNNIVPKDWVKL